MRSCSLATVVVAAILGLSGCGGNSTPTQQHDPFDLEGSWLYLGPSDGPHTLMITSSSMVYADVSGEWKSTWTIKTYDNTLHHFQVAFDSGSGTYLPTGQNMSGTYELSGTLLTVQLAGGTSYPPLESAGSCTGTDADGTPLPDCRLYIEQK
jgi:hypothetical protein